MTAKEATSDTKVGPHQETLPGKDLAQDGIWGQQNHRSSFLSLGTVQNQLDLGTFSQWCGVRVSCEGIPGIRPRGKRNRAQTLSGRKRNLRKGSHDCALGIYLAGKNPRKATPDKHPHKTRWTPNTEPKIIPLWIVEIEPVSLLTSPSPPCTYTQVSHCNLSSQVTLYFTRMLYTSDFNTSGKKFFASRVFGCTRWLRCSGRNLANLDAAYHGTVHPNAMHYGTVRSDAPRHGTVRPDAVATAYASRRVVSGHFLSGCRMSRQMSSGQRMPRHLPSAREVSGHSPFERRVSRQMSSGRCVPWHLPSGCGVSGHLPSRRGVSGHLPSGCSACLTNAECQGKWDPDEAYDGTPHIDNRVVTVVAYATVRARYIAAKTIKHTFGSRHCDSNQFYSLHLMYIYIPRHIDGIALHESNKGSLPDETRRNENNFNEVDTNEDASREDNNE